MTTMINSTQSSIATTVLNEATNQYNKNGIDGAGGYLLVIIGIIFIFGTIWYVKSSQKRIDKLIDMKNDENNKLIALFENSLKKQAESLNSINKQIIVELKEISQEVRDGINYLNTKSIEMNEKFMCTLNDEKSLNTDEFIGMSKIILENNSYRLKMDLDSRIELNNLYANQENLLGETGEIYAMVKKRVMDMKSGIRCLNFKNDRIKDELIEHIDLLMKDVPNRLCLIFKVSNDNYLKVELFRKIKSLTYSIINGISEIEIKE